MTSRRKDSLLDRFPKLRRMNQTPRIFDKSQNNILAFTRTKMNLLFKEEKEKNDLISPKFTRGRLTASKFFILIAFRSINSGEYQWREG